MTEALPERKIVITNIKPAALSATKWIGTAAGVSGAIMIAINLGVLYPMIRFLPSFYGWLMRSKVLRLCGELALLDQARSHRRLRFARNDCAVRSAGRAGEQPQVA